MYTKLAKSLFICGGGLYTLFNAFESFELKKEKYFLLLGNGLRDSLSREINNFSNFQMHRIGTFAKHDIKYLQFGPVYDAAILNSSNQLYIWLKKQFACNISKGDNKQQTIMNPFLLMSNVRSVKFTKNKVWILTYDGKIFFSKVDYQKKQKISQPEEIKYLSSVGIIQIASGTNHILFLNKTGEVHALGENKFGQCGSKKQNKDVLQIPKKIQNLPSIKKIFSGATHSFAIDEHGKLYGWGNNSRMQLSNEKMSKFFIDKPQQIKGPILNIEVQKVAAGNDFSFIYGKNKSNGKYQLYSAGSNKNGQLALNISIEQQDLTLVETLSDFQKNGQPAKIDKIQCGKNHCIAKIENYVFSWGSNQFGQQANSTIQNILTPKILKLQEKLLVKQIYAGQNATGIILQEKSQ